MQVWLPNTVVAMLSSPKDRIAWELTFQFPNQAKNGGKHNLQAHTNKIMSIPVRELAHRMSIGEGSYLRVGDNATE